MAMLANSFSTENPVSSASGMASVIDLGFVASVVRVANDKASPVYVSLGSTVATTGGYKTCSGESYQLDGVATAFIALASTTTSTGTVVRVLAVG